jgi:hypothetical protein
MAPRLWQAIRGVHAEEVAARGLPKAVEMFVRSDERRFTLQVNAGFFSYLPDRYLDDNSLSSGHTWIVGGARRGV